MLRSQFKEIIKPDLSDDCVCILAGTMADVAPHEEELHRFSERLQELVDEMGLFAQCITSAKDNTGIESLRELIKLAIKEYHLNAVSSLKRKIL